MVKNDFLYLKWFLQLLFKPLTCIFSALCSKQVISRIGIRVRVRVRVRG